MTMLAIEIEHVATIGSYFNERCKYKTNVPMFSKKRVRPNDEIMVYQEDTKRHAPAIVSGDVEAESIEFVFKDKSTGSYSPSAARHLVTVDGRELPKVYRRKQ